jgi:hypothetical protein
MLLSLILAGKCLGWGERKASKSSFDRTEQNADLFWPMHAYFSGHLMATC